VAIRSRPRPTQVVALRRAEGSISIGIGASYAPELRKIKEQHAHLPVIMVTAYGDDERRRKASEFGASEFVTKPVDFDLLKHQLQQLGAPS